ncbi:hypothetical protein WG66_012379 [Moniliophthora roreri]|nr:hypothetical protein WG66_012379 [Moniliophthora roreri]
MNRLRVGKSTMGVLLPINKSSKSRTGYHLSNKDSLAERERKQSNRRRRGSGRLSVYAFNF